MPDDEIWLPVAKTKATVRDGDVKVWNEMEFTVVKIAKPPTGFTSKAPVPEDDD